MHIDAFLGHVARGGDLDAITGDGGARTYAQLHALVGQQRQWLASAGLRGTVVVLVGGHDAQSLSLLLALWAEGNVVALSVPKPDERIEALAAACGAAGVIRCDAAGAQLRERGADAPPATVRALLGQGEPGFIVFSSGTTGPAKGVVHRLAPYLQRYAQSEACGAILAFLLFDHIGGLVTVLQSLATHGTLVVPAQRTPQEIGRCIERFGVATLHVSPTLLNLALVSGAFRRHGNTSLRRIYFGSEPVAADLPARVAQALPGVALQQLYGMSEIGVLPCESRDADRTWIAIPDPGYHLKVVDGILHVRGSTNLVGYLSGAAPLCEEGYFNTGDLAEEREGFFRIKGRAVDLINVGGKKVCPSDVENVLAGMDNVGDVVVYAEPSPIVGQIVAACFTLIEPEAPAQLKARVLARVRGVLAPEQIPRRISVSDKPLHTARFKKVRRPALAG
jgi:acyl-CoA synthetase (AMP-forming)/AMP-acid ligase II